MRLCKTVRGMFWKQRQSFTVIIRVGPAEPVTGVKKKLKLFRRRSKLKPWTGQLKRAKAAKTLRCCLAPAATLLYDSFQSHGIYWPYYTWLWSFWRIFHRVEMKRGFILHKHFSQTVRYSSGRRIGRKRNDRNIRIFFVAESQNPCPIHVPESISKGLGFCSKVGDQPCGTPMLKLKDQSSRVESTIEVYQLVSELFSSNSLNFSGVILFWCAWDSESDQSGQESNSLPAPNLSRPIFQQPAQPILIMACCYPPSRQYTRSSNA